jgi:phage tail protein X
LWLIFVDRDLDLDLHAIWQESSGIPTPPPCLATDSEYSRQILSDEVEPARYETSGSSSIECFFHPTYDKLSASKWTGPDPLSMSTQASDLFLYMSALAFPKEVHWVEFRLVRFDRKSSESIGEHLFFLPRVETATWNLRRVRGQLLDTISWHEFGALGTSFRLSLWPRMEPLPHSSRLTLPSLAALPTTVSLDPRIFVNNILGNYREIGP